MYIIIVGAGKVGRTLSLELAQSNHHITVIDTNEQLVDSLMNKMDINGVVGNGANIETLHEVSVESADVFIATTEYDEINIIACALAKKMGVKHTVSRVRNPEYSKQFDVMRSALGITLMINPELSAARDIARSIRFSAATSVQTLAGNRVSLVEVLVTEQSIIANMPLAIFRQQFGSVLVCIIERDEQVFIPSGTDVLLPDDKIFVSGLPKDMAKFNKDVKWFDNAIKSVMVVGGGKIAQYLIPLLEHHHIDVKVIEQQMERCETLSEELPKARIIHGNGSDPEVLQEQGLNTYDAFISLTNMDEENLLMGLYAAKQGVPRVITKLSRTNLLKVVDSKPITHVVSPKDIVASEIAHFVRSRANAIGSNIEGLYRVADGKVEVLVFKIEQNCRIIGIPLSHLSLKKELLVAYIIRNGKLIFPNGQDELHVNDRVIIVTTQRDFTMIDDILEEK